MRRYLVVFGIERKNSKIEEVRLREVPMRGTNFDPMEKKINKLMISIVQEDREIKEVEVKQIIPL